MLQPSFFQEVSDKVFCYPSHLLQEDSTVDFTIASFNFSLPQSLELQHVAKQEGIHSEIFSLTNALPKDFNDVLESVKRTKKLVVIDDSRSINRSSDRLRIGGV